MKQDYDFDLTILGGGMAGLCLARQLKMRRPEARILVLERRNFPAPEAAFKVGESSVEIGAYYLRETLGLAQHLRERQLPKLGLRFFFGSPEEPFGEGLELGLTSTYPTPAHQIDRGRLENFLNEDAARSGITVLDGCRVQREVTLDAENGHIVHFLDGDGERQVRTRWVVDTSGRSAILKRQLDLMQEIDHTINSAWFRVGAPIRVDDWREWDPLTNNEGKTAKRWLSTVHLMGEGYWVWLIPLAGDATSVGIVADPRIHDLSTFNSFDKAMTWLRKHEPECAHQIHARGGEPLDFLAIKKIGWSSKQVFSASRWALSGEAGVFLDPFYSPGSDFIALSNTMICALIERDLKGRPIQALTEVLQTFYLDYFQHSLRLFENQYPMFGNPGVMTAKVVWDYSVYWTFPAFLFIQGRLTEPSCLSRIQPLIREIGEIDAQMQAFFRRWHHVWNEPVGRTFVDQAKLGSLARLNAGLTEALDAEGFHRRFEKNVQGLRDLASELVGRAAVRHPSLATFRPDHPLRGAEQLGELWRNFAAV